MSEILRDIEKELKRDRWLKRWQTYRTQFLFAVGALAFTALLLGGSYFYNKQKVESASSAFDVALALQGKSALAAFAALAKEGGVYGALASFHEAALHAEQGRWRRAVKIYDSLATNSYLTEPLRDLSQIYAAQILINRVPYTEIEQRLADRVSDKSSLRYSALEILALAAIIDGKSAQARKFLQPLIDEPNAPDTLTARAQLLLNKLDSQKATKK